MQVHAAVSEADVGRLASGLPATFVVDAYPDQRFAGVIHQIRDAPQTQQNVVTYDAVIDVDNPDHRLKPGMTANVTFVYAERKNVLRIPSAALRFRPPEELLASVAAGDVPTKKHKKDKGKKNQDGARGVAAENAGEAGEAGEAARRSVWVLRQDRLSEIPVELGVADGSKVEVRGGALAEGDFVVTDAIDKSERAEAKGKKGLF